MKNNQLNVCRAYTIAIMILNVEVDKIKYCKLDIVQT